MAWPCRLNPEPTVLHVPGKIGIDVMSKFGSAWFTLHPSHAIYIRCIDNLISLSLFWILQRQFHRLPQQVTSTGWPCSYTGMPGYLKIAAPPSAWLGRLHNDQQVGRRVRCTSLGSLLEELQGHSFASPARIPPRTLLLEDLPWCSVYLLARQNGHEDAISRENSSFVFIMINASPSTYLFRNMTLQGQPLHPVEVRFPAYQSVIDSVKRTPQHKITCIDGWSW